MPTIEHFCCLNNKCADYGLRDHGNLRFRGWSGQGHRIRMIFCYTCKVIFSERKGTILEQRRLSKDKIISILDHVRDGCGTRSTSRLVKVDKNTVTRYILKSGMHAIKMHNFLIPVSPQTKEVQLDEKWSFVKSKNELISETEDNLNQKTGQNWDHVAIDAESRLILSIVPGKRTSENCEILVNDLNKRTGARTDMLITSDDYAPYTTAIKNAYGEKISKQKDKLSGKKFKSEIVMPKDLCYATVSKKRKNGHVVQITRKIVFGTLFLLMLMLTLSRVSSTVNTSFIERYNGTDRSQNKRKSRKTYSFSKDWNTHNASTFFIGYCYNFCWPVRTLNLKDMNGKRIKRTPAMAAGLADHIWTMEEWACYPVPGG